MTGSHNARERLVEAAVGLLRCSGAPSVSMDAASAAAGAGKMSAYRHFTSKDDLVAAALERYNPRHVRWLAGGGSHGVADAAGVAGSANMSSVASEPGVEGPTSAAGAGGVSDEASENDVGSAIGLGSATGVDSAIGMGSVSGVGTPTGLGSLGGAGGAAGSDSWPAARGSGGVRGLGEPGGIGEDADADPAEAAGRILSAFDRLESAAGGENFRGCPFVDAALAASGPDRRIAAIAGRHKQDLVQALAGLAARAGMREAEEVGAAVALVIDGAATQAAVAPDPAARRLVVRRGRRIAEMLLATGSEP